MDAGIGEIGCTDVGNTPTGGADIGSRIYPKHAGRKLQHETHRRAKDGDYALITILL